MKAHKPGRGLMDGFALKDYSPDQERPENGRFGAGGGESKGNAAKGKTHEYKPETVPLATSTSQAAANAQAWGHNLEARSANKMAAEKIKAAGPPTKEALKEKMPSDNKQALDLTHTVLTSISSGTPAVEAYARHSSNGEKDPDNEAQEVLEGEFGFNLGGATAGNPF